MFCLLAGGLHGQADVLEAAVPSDQGEVGRAAGQSELPPGQEHAHHRHPQSKKSEGKRHQRKIWYF